MVIKCIYAPFVASDGVRRNMLHSSPMLHGATGVGEDRGDDRSAVTFWLPTSEHRREEMAKAFEAIAAIFRGGA